VIGEQRRELDPLGLIARAHVGQDHADVTRSEDATLEVDTPAPRNRTASDTDRTSARSNEANSEATSVDADTDADVDAVTDADGRGTDPAPPPAQLATAGVVTTAVATDRIPISQMHTSATAHGSLPSCRARFDAEGPIGEIAGRHVGRPRS